MELGPHDPAEGGTRVIPRLPSRDLKRTAAFFGRIGFNTVLIGHDDGYLIVRRAWAEIHYRPEPAMDPLTTAESCYIRLADADAAVAPLLPLLPLTGMPRLIPPANRAWGMREANLFDPDNNLLIIGAPVVAPSGREPIHQQPQEGLSMFIAMNRFKVVKGQEETFERIWSTRKTRLDEMEGFMAFHLLKGPEKEGYTLYSSHTTWASRERFVDWTRSEQFRESHKGAGGHSGLYLGHPEFEGFETVLSESSARTSIAAE
jgi:heme-degrading monooxygenase HmoA